MEFAELQPELQQWIRDAVKSGHHLSVMVDALLKAGYQPGISQAVEQCILDHGIGRRDTGTAPARPAHTQSPETSAPWIVAQTSERNGRFHRFAADGNQIDLGDRLVDVRFAMKRPNIVLFANLLSDSECDALVAMSKPNLKPSRVVNSERGSFDLRDTRTSSGTHFARGETPVITAIEARISRLLDVPEERGEPLQILNYQVGGEYRPHYDFFNPEKPGNHGVLCSGGQRVGTLIMYLNDVSSGGATVFPRVGLDILPQKGAALFFSYTSDSGELDYQTLHGGSPVLAGEKWIATKWLRTQDYAPGVS
ncbi:2OG-Fe(II) oxygenase [Microbulbifer sp. HZ11]|uniref:2OG-Fe(II) oxygenase n=1 Tax=unclassified Microbulbifer TaxID=2619833 RepID=UPI0005B7711A|nr:2OG-Fe(II) oxygenase [Microbulbifer sp. HZ11]